MYAIRSYYGVAAILLDPRTRTVGMVHVALPESRINPAKVAERPGYFADTGIPALLKEMAKLGCDPRGRGMVVKLAGGAKIMDPNVITSYSIHYTKLYE